MKAVIEIIYTYYISTCMIMRMCYNCLIKLFIETSVLAVAIWFWWQCVCLLWLVDENGPLVERWKWSRPNARVYTMLIQGLAASLRVSDALSVVKYICEVGVSPSEEVRLNEFLCLHHFMSRVLQKLNLFWFLRFVAGSLWEDSEVS